MTEDDNQRKTKSQNKNKNMLTELAGARPLAEPVEFDVVRLEHVLVVRGEVAAVDVVQDDITPLLQ